MAEELTPVQITERWLAENGFTIEKKTVSRGKTIFVVEQDGVEDTLEVPLTADACPKYLAHFKLVFDDLIELRMNEADNAMW